MDSEELKRKLMGLWERTTHNSKDLLAFLFEYYFDMDNMEFKEIDGKVTGALCCIPYSFGYGAKKLKGLYILALSAEEGYKKKGLLTELLENLNNKVKNDYDFTFLVPHTELLADYFGTRGYLSSFFIFEERYTPLHDFRNDYLLSLQDSDARIREMKKALLDEISVNTIDKNSEKERNEVKDFIMKAEQSGSSSVNLCHTSRDLDYILSDFSIRNLNCFVSKDADGKISGVAFTQKEEMKRVRVVTIHVSDPCSYYAILENIRNTYPEHSISVNTFDPKYQMSSLIQYTYASSNPEGGDLDNTFGEIEVPFNINKLLQPLGMVQLLNYEGIIEYLAATRSDVDFKIYIRDLIEPEADRTQGEDEKVFIVSNGKCRVEPYEKYKKDRTVLNLSKKELSELLLRKNDSSNLIMEAFGIPRLNLQIQLLPY